MKNNTKRMFIYIIPILLITACSALLTLQEKTLKITSQMINGYCLLTSTTQRNQFRDTINKQLDGHSIQIYCKEGLNSWLIVANE